MKAIPGILIAMLFFATANAAEDDPSGSENPAATPRPFLPPVLGSVHLAMTLDSFNREHYNPNPDHWRTVPAGTVFARHYEDQPFRAIGLIFHSDLKVLLEVRLYFHDESAAIEYASQHLQPGSEFVPGEISSSGQKLADMLRRPLPNGLSSRAWQWEDKVYIVAEIPGTKWGPRL